MVLEEPLVCAMLLSLAGVNSIYSYRWHITPDVAKNDMKRLLQGKSSANETMPANSYLFIFSDLLSKPTSVGQLYRSVVMGLSNTNADTSDNGNVPAGESMESKTGSNTLETPRYVLHSSAVYGLPHLTLVEAV